MELDDSRIPEERRNRGRTVRKPYIERRTIVVRKAKEPRPWYNQGWFWLIVVIAAMAFVGYFLSGIGHRLADVNDSLQQQNDILSEQNHILQGIQSGIHSLANEIRTGFTQMIDAVRDAVNEIKQQFTQN